MTDKMVVSVPRAVFMERDLFLQAPNMYTKIPYGVWDVHGRIPVQVEKVILDPYGQVAEVYVSGSVEAIARTLGKQAEGAC